MKRTISTLILIACAALTMSAASFPVRESYHEFSEFTSIEVSGGLSVRIVPSDTYATTLKVDDQLRNYVEQYVRDKTLHLVYSEGDVPRDIKKLYRGKDAPTPTLELTVNVPSISAITLSGGYLTITGGTAPDSFSVTLSKDAAANVTSSSRSISVNATGSSNLKLIHTSSSYLTLTADGKSVIVTEGESANVSATLSANSKVTMTGKCPSVSLIAGGSSVFDALNLKNTSSSVTARGGTATVSPKSELSLDMDGGTVYFFGDPAIRVIKIHKASVAPYGVRLK